MSEQELMSFIDVAKAANIPLSSLYYFNAKGVGPATVKIGRRTAVPWKPPFRHPWNW